MNMKTFTTILALASVFLINAQSEKTANIKITIENVLSEEGSVIASLHNEDTFLKSPGVKTAKEPAKKGEVTLLFENVSPGTYAILAIHDSNSNNSIDFDASGMPLESYGQTGDINPFGPPIFADAKFEVNGEDQEFRIRFLK